MAEIVIPDKNTGDLYPASEWNTMKAAINDNNSKITTLEGSDIVRVLSVDDLPAPVGGVISLVDANKKYLFSGIVDIGVNTIQIAANGVVLMGESSTADGFTSSTASTLINCVNNNLVLQNVNIVANNATQVISFSGSSLNIADLYKVIITTTGKLGAISTAASFSILDCVFLNFTDGFSMSGSFSAARFEGVFAQNFTGILLDLGGCTTSAIDISACAILGQLSGAQFLDIAPNGANISSGGLGTIQGNKFVEEFAGLTTITGYSSFETSWAVLLNTSNIIPSDRLEPQGFGAYFDDASSTQTFDATASKLEINGLDSRTYTDKLPLSIRGTGELWDTTDNKITPVTLDDTFNIRVNLTVTATTSNPTRFELILDIGGGSNPSIPIVIEGKTLKTGTFPQNYVVNFPVYDRTTFLANGGQIFIVVDSGTMTVEDRSISIFRNGSGAS